MFKFREKWLAALALAILLHIGLFFIFYINQSENRLNYSTGGNETNTTQIAVNNLGEDYTLADSSTYATTLEDNKVSAVLDSNQKGNIEDGKQNIEEDSEKDRSVSPDASENKSNLETINNQKSQELDKETEGQSAREAKAELPRKVNGLIESKDNIAVLNRDIPGQYSKDNVNGEYASINGELEEINNQLSDAINEVKRRNQQQIDQSQQPRTDESFE